MTVLPEHNWTDRGGIFREAAQEPCQKTLRGSFVVTIKPLKGHISLAI
jgi:hypothetical protein